MSSTGPVWPLASGSMSGSLVGKPDGDGALNGENRGKMEKAYMELVGTSCDLRLMIAALTPPPEACQLTAMYFPPADTTSVSHAEPLILTFS